MKTEKPNSRTAATKPEETRHLSTGEEEALELQSEAEHSTGVKREKLTKRAENKAGK